MADIQVGKGYVQIIPSMHGIAGSIARLIEPESAKAGSRSGQTMGERMTGALSRSLQGSGKVMTKFGGFMTSKVTKPALGAGTALMGLTLWKGLGRLRGLDMAQAKLRGIGIQGERLNKVMDTVTETVTGTAFTTAEATNVAATAIASGVKEGKDLEFYLKNVANAAAFANIPLTDMGGIFAKVQAKGRLTGDVLQQLGAHGIGAAGIIAEEFGKTPDVIEEMVSRGEISAEMFYQAMDNYMGGAAKEVGDTWDVALTNIGSRLAILGEKFLGNWKDQTGAFYVLKDALQDVLDFILTLNDKAEELGKKFGSALSEIIEDAKTLIGYWNSLDENTRKLVTNAVAGFGAIAVAIGPLLKIAGPLTGLAGKVMGTVDNTVASIAERLGKFSGGVLTGGSKFLSVFLQLFGAAPFIGAVLLLFGLLQQTFGEQINALFTLMQTKGPQIIDGFIQGAIAKIPDLILLGAELIANLMDTITALLPSIIEGGIQIVTSLIVGLIQALPTLIPAAFRMIWTLFESIINNLPTIIQGGMEILSALIDGVFKMLPMVGPAMTTVIVGIAGAIARNLPQILMQGVQLMLRLLAGIIQALPAVLAAIPGLLWQIANGFMEYDWLSVGKDIIAGIASGISSAGHQLWKAAKEVLGGFKEQVLSYFGIKSPSRWARDMVGRFIPQGIAVGIEKDGDSIQKSFNRLADQLVNPFDTDYSLDMTSDLERQISKQAVRFSGSQTSGVSSKENNITINNYSPESLTEREIARQTELTMKRLAFELR